MIDSRNDTDYDIDENADNDFRVQKQMEALMRKQPNKERSEHDRER